MSFASHNHAFSASSVRCFFHRKFRSDVFTQPRPFSACYDVIITVVEVWVPAWRPLSIPGSALTVLIVSASCSTRGDGCICQNSAGLSQYLHSYLMCASGRLLPIANVSALGAALGCEAAVQFLVAVLAFKRRICPSGEIACVKPRVASLEVDLSSVVGAQCRHHYPRSCHPILVIKQPITIQKERLFSRAE